MRKTRRRERFLNQGTRPRAFEARLVTCLNARPIVEQVVNAGADADFVHSAMLRLADLSLKDHRARPPARSGPTPAQLKKLSLPSTRKGFSPRAEYALLHHDAGDDQPARSRGRPSQAKVLSVLSILARHFDQRTGRPQYRLLLALTRAIFPPLFLAQAADEVHALEQLRDAVKKYRRRCRRRPRRQGKTLLTQP